MPRYLEKTEEKMARCRALLFVLCAVWLLPEARGYFAHIDAHAQECFFDRVSSGMKMGLTFEVVEGGFLDIDVKVNTLYYTFSWINDATQLLNSYCLYVLKI